LGLAGRTGRAGAGVGDPGVRVEARGVGHRNPGPGDRALEGSAEVAVAGEAEPPALGVPDPQPLDRWGLLLGLFTHGSGRSSARACSLPSGREPVSERSEEHRRTLFQAPWRTSGDW